MIKKYYLFLIIWGLLLGLFFFAPQKVYAGCDLITARKDAITKFSISPAGGALGTSITLKASIAWVTTGEETPCDGTVVKIKITYNKNEEVIKEQTIPVPAGAGVTIMANVRADNNYVDGSVIKFKFLIGHGLNSLPIKEEVKDFVITSTGGVCAYVDLRTGIYVCHEPPWLSDGTAICSLDCRNAAKAAGYPNENCSVIQSGNCGKPANLTRMGCLVPNGQSDPTHSTWQCTEPSASITDCRSINCGNPPSSCVKMATQAEQALCGTIVTTGGCTGSGCNPNTTCGGAGQPACPTGQTTTYPFEVPNPLQGGANTVAELVSIIVKWIFSIAIPIAVAVIVYSGILFLTSKGDPAQVTKAKQMLQYAIIGLAIILVGSGFISLIRSILELGGEPTASQTYSCNSETGQCVADTSGLYGTEADCVATCSPRPKFSCNADTKQCSSDPNGNYGTLDACSAACNPTIYYKYSCDEDRGICYRAVGGAYDNESDCNNSCPSGGI